MPSLQHLLLIVFCAAVLCACEKDESPSAATANDAWRSVLDDHARVLSLAVAPDLRMAYDTENARLYKVWRGDELQQGAVYNSAHGPQPVSRGATYFQLQEGHWSLQQGDSKVDVSPRFQGHRLTEGGVSVVYQLKHAGDTIAVTETPAISIEGKGLQLLRHFEVQGLAAGSRLILEEQYRPQTANGELSSNRVELVVGSNDHTLSLPVSVEMPAPGKAEAVTQEPAGKLAMADSDCNICHNITEKTVGPSFTAIARRYSKNEDNIRRLVDKIRRGGSGSWGAAAMTPHPNLSDSDLYSMVDYILGLGRSSGAIQRQQWTLDQDSIQFSFADDNPELEFPAQGLMLYLEYFSGDQPNVGDLREQSPAMSALVPGLHTVDMDGFDVVKENFAWRALGNLVIPKDGEYTLRLVSDDGAYLYLDDNQVIDNWGFHGPQAADYTAELSAGEHALEVVFFQGGGDAALSLQWFNQDKGDFEVIPPTALRVNEDNVLATRPVVTDTRVVKSIPGDQREVAGVHPAFDLHQARPDGFKPLVGGIDFLSDGRMVVSSWEPRGPIYLVSNYQADDPAAIEVKEIAHGLAEPLGVKVVDDQIYVMQKQELTHLVDEDGDGDIDFYENVSNDWIVTTNFHEFGFGLAYRDGKFYASLATAILPGGASAPNQSPDRGKVLEIDPVSGKAAKIVSGLRTPNGVGFGVDGKLFVADNQGDWLPANKIVEITPGAWYGSRSVDFEGTANLTATRPVVWLQQDEIGNSPSQPAQLNLGPWQNQMIHGEVTHGGLKRVFAEEVDGRLQGAVFRFTQGIEAGVNRIAWAPDGSLLVGGIGNPGNWGHAGGLWYGLQRLVYNGNSVFEMLSVSARSNGFVIEFSEPIAEGQYVSAADFDIQQWYYQPTAEYGGPKLGVETLTPSAFEVSPDRRRVSVQLPGMKADHVVYFRIVRPFSSELDHELWTTEAWYTLNKIPQNKALDLEGKAVSNNQLTPSEVEAGWQMLFDGKSTAGLHSYNQNSLGKGWQVDKGNLHLVGRKPGDEEGWQTPNGGDAVITAKPVENFELYLEWKISQDGNSGILYLVQEEEKYQYPFFSGPEFQLLDNVGHPDGKIVKHRSGDLYDLIESRVVTVGEIGSWNRVRIVLNNGHLQHWLNGYKVVDTQLWSPEWDALVAASKFAQWEVFAKARRGHIALQDHGNEIWFRNIKLRELPAGAAEH